MEGQETAAQRVSDLKAQLAAAEAAAAGEQPAPGDGTQPSQGLPTATAEGTGAIAAAPAAAADPAKPAVLDLLKQAQQDAAQASGGETSPHSFLEDLRTVADRLVADGRLVETDLLSPGEATKVTSTLVKVVGELIGKVL